MLPPISRRDCAQTFFKRELQTFDFTKNPKRKDSKMEEKFDFFRQFGVRQRKDGRKKDSKLSFWVDHKRIF